MTRERSGIVYLVGAGPGDPGLLTVRARELIDAADVVAYDRLVSPAILSLIGASVEKLCVGRRHGAGKTTYRIHPAVLERARAGKSVVRLKAGDPLIFGRGGEEAEELAEAGFPFEIVPGISAALGAAAYAGIPLTHRELASRVTFATGHDLEGDPAATEGTLVLYMGAHSLAANLLRLVASGRAPTTPAAYIAAATTPSQQVIVGTLATLVELTRDVDPIAPALIVIGEVVRLRERIAWPRPRPLAGRTLLVGRARPGRSAIAAELRRLGATVVEAPDVDSESLADRDHAIARIRDARAVIFGCAAGVDAVAEHVDLAGMHVIAIGSDASTALGRHHITPAVQTRGACLDALREHTALGRGAGPYVLVTADGGRPSLERDLADLGVEVEAIAAYRYVYRSPCARVPAIDLIVLPSSSAARAVLAGELAHTLRDVPIVAMGQRTEDAARRCGAYRVVRAPEDTPTGLISVAISTMGGR